MSSGHLKKKNFMQKLICFYEENIVGKEPKPGEFWDMVIISAGSEDLKLWYEKQIQRKLDLGHLPIGIEFKVYSDYNGVRCGDGGATIYIINQLLKEYGNEILNKKLFLISAGGYSKRLPSHSCISKLFSCLPKDSNHGSYDILDMKLINYIPFIKMMKNSGIFFTASDDIESFNINDDDIKNFDQQLRFIDDTQPCLVSLAHPSSLKIGTGHGVFKFNENILKSWNTDSSTIKLIQNCIEVFQKPSIEKMHQQGLVVNDNENKEIVFTDSAFWFNKRLALKLNQLFIENTPITGETSMYSDFMIFQGVGETKESLTKLMASTNPEKKFQKNIASLMKDIPLHILALPESKFHHFGTILEYLDAFTSVSELGLEMGFQRIVSSNLVDLDQNNIKGVLIECQINEPNVVIPQSAILEFCKIDSGTQCKINDDTIMNGCYLKDNIGDIPGGFLFHTIPIEDKKFVTVAFGIKNDLKNTVSNLDYLYLGTKSVRQLIPTGFICDSENICLWNAKIFPSRNSRDESLKCTLNLLRGINSQQDNERFSMADLILLKDTNRLLLKPNKF